MNLVPVAEWACADSFGTTYLCLSLLALTLLPPFLPPPNVPALRIAVVGACSPRDTFLLCQMASGMNREPQPTSRYVLANSPVSVVVEVFEVVEVVSFWWLCVWGGEGSCLALIVLLSVLHAWTHCSIQDDGYLVSSTNAAAAAAIICCPCVVLACACMHVLVVSVLSNVPVLCFFHLFGPLVFLCVVCVRCVCVCA